MSEQNFNVYPVHPFFSNSPDKYRGSLLLDIMSPFAHTLRHAVLIQIYFRVFKAGLLRY